MASLTNSINVWRGSKSSPGFEKGLQSLGASGCFVFRTSSDRMLGGSTSSAEETMRTTPRMLPSSICEDMRFGRAFPFFFLLNFRAMSAPSKLVKSSFWQKLPICLFTGVEREVFFCCPARDGAFKQILGIKKSRRQLSTSEGFDMILDMVLRKARAKLVLDAFGMNLSTWYWVARISSNTVLAEGSGAFLTGSDLFIFWMPCDSPDDWPVPSGMSTCKSYDGGGLANWACTSGRCRQWGQVKGFL